MDRAPKGPGPFSMDYAYLDYVSVPAFGQVVRDEVLYFAGIEGVQIEDAVNGEFDHILIMDIHQDRRLSTLVLNFVFFVAEYFQVN